MLRFQSCRIQEVEVIEDVGIRLLQHKLLIGDGWNVHVPIHELQRVYDRISTTEAILTLRGITLILLTKVKFFINLIQFNFVKLGCEFLFKCFSIKDSLTKVYLKLIHNSLSFRVMGSQWEPEGKFSIQKLLIQDVKEHFCTLKFRFRNVLDVGLSSCTWSYGLHGSTHLLR